MARIRERKGPIPHPFDEFGIDRVHLRELLETCEGMSDEEVVEELVERPVTGVTPGGSTEREVRAVLAPAVRDERGLMALGEALGSEADPRHLARSEASGHASLAEFFRQLDELVSQTERIAEEARDVRDRFRARFDDRDSEDDPDRALPALVRALEHAWANARRIRFVMRSTAHGLPPWRRDEGEEWKS